MFERFTAAARAAVRTAAGAARGAGTHEIDLDHLLAALLPVVPATGLSRDAADAVLDDVAEARRRAGLSQVDARALAELGIDLDAVVAAAERELGRGVLTARARRSGGRLRLAPAAREALAAALRQARALGDRELRAEHLLLGVLAQRADRVPADVLAARGVTTATLIAALQSARRGAA
jgi:ATP-dependent Clp protease ATP-binding subunit ClpA